MKLIDNFVEKFHNYSLPTPEKCFVLEEGDELKDSTKINEEAEISIK